MNQFLQRFPKLLLGAIVLVLVLGFLVFNDPPTTLCDIQMETVNKKLIKYFYSEKSTGTYGQSIGTVLKACRESNSAGGCYETLKRLKFLEKQVRTIPSECGTHASTERIRKNLDTGIKLIVKIGWGGKPPESMFEKQAWLDSTDMGLYCRLKRQSIRLMGTKRWKVYRETVMAVLPGADALTRKKRWEKSLFSFPCKGYL